MSTKTIIISLVGFILIGSLVYFSMEKKKLTLEATAILPVQTTNTKNSTQKDGVIKEPTATSSTDEIINYIVDGQSNNEPQAAQASLNATSSFSEGDLVIKTNF